MHFSLVILAMVLLANTVHAEEEFGPSGFVSRDAVKLANVVTRIEGPNHYNYFPLMSHSLVFSYKNSPIDFTKRFPVAFDPKKTAYEIFPTKPKPSSLPRNGLGFDSEGFAVIFDPVKGTISIGKDSQPVGGSIGVGANVGIGINLGPFGFSRYQENNGIKMNEPNNLESQQLNDAINA